MARQLVLGILAYLVVMSASACRCHQRSLEFYFSQSDWVWVSTLIDYRQVGDKVQLYFHAPQRFYKSTGQPPTKVVTSSNSTECGLHIELGKPYVLFGQGDSQRPALAQVHSCNGSRVIEEDTETRDEIFPGLPLKYLPSQLDTLSALDELAEISSHESPPGNVAGEHLVGLLTFTKPQVEIYSRPDGQGTARSAPITALRRLEISYEEPALVVFASRPPWFKVSTSEGYGWVHQGEGMFHPYDSLPINRLSYLNKYWSGYLWPEPGAGLPFMVLPGAATSGRSEVAVEVLRSERLGGSLWFQVRLTKADPCEQPGIGGGASGWIPGYGRRGDPILWFHSRGC